MKHLALTSILILAFYYSFSQGVQKGNLMGFHVISIELKPNIAMDQFRDFYVSRVIAAYDKALGEAKLYIVKGIRGQYANTLGLLYLFPSETIREKYFNKDGSVTAAGKTASRRVAPTGQELAKLGTFTTKYTDWIVP